MPLHSHVLVCWALLTLGSAGCARHAVTTSNGPSSQVPPSPEQVLSQDMLRADLRQLARLIEDTHPDPYARSGGRIAFHRRLDSLLRGLPQEGMSVEAFFRYARPLVASVGDGHTTLHAPGRPAPNSALLAAEFEAVEERLYVRRVHRASLRPLLGATLTGVEGLPFEQLASRMGSRLGADNHYQNLQNLAQALRSPSDLAELLGRPSLALPVRFELRQPNGTPATALVEVAADTPAETAEPPSRLSLPPPNSADLAWSFLQEDKSVAYLRIDSMMRYREAFEVWRSTGYTQGLGERLDTAARAAGQPHLPTVEARIAAVPSATELLRELFSAMRQARTRTLLVDLRHNSGGNSTLAHILGYFLYPLEQLLSQHGGYQLTRYSQLYFESHQADSLHKVSERSGLVLEPGDMDFRPEHDWYARRGRPPSAEELARLRSEFLEFADLAPTFAQEVRSGAFNAAWTPRVMVLTSARTYSAGFDLAVLLRAQGATLVGVPPSQAGNCFIDVAPFRLRHSALGGTLSFKYSLLFPEDPATGVLLRPDLELSYQQLAALGFDPHASAIIALQHAK